MSQADYDKVKQIIADIKIKQYEHEVGGKEPQELHPRERAQQQRMERTYKDEL